MRAALLLVVALACRCGDDGAQVDLQDSGSAPSDTVGGADAAPADATDAVSDGSDATGAPDAGIPDAVTAPDGDAVFADATPDVLDVEQGPTVEGWCESWSAAWCELLARCPLPGRDAPGPACVQSAAAECFHGAGIPEATAAFALSFDGDAAQACVSGLAALSCDVLGERLTTTQGPPVPACKGVLTPQQSAGELCALGIECMGGTCVFDGACPGTCVALGAPGDPCGPDAFCDFSRAACLGDTCVALPDEVGDPCPDQLCAAPLACQGGLCAAPSLAGGLCGAGEPPCYPGLVCVQQTAAAAGHCAAPRTLGEPCFDSDDCAAGLGGQLLCVGGECQSAPLPGEPCFDFACDTDGTCDVAALPPTCVQRPSTDEACANGSICAAGLFCSQGVCAALLPAGAACTGQQQCATGRCPAGTCVDAGAPACPATY